MDYQAWVDEEGISPEEKTSRASAGYYQRAAVKEQLGENHLATRSADFEVAVIKENERRLGEPDGPGEPLDYYENPAEYEAFTRKHFNLIGIHSEEFAEGYYAGLAPHVESKFKQGAASAVAKHQAEVEELAEQEISKVIDRLSEQFNSDTDDALTFEAQEGDDVGGDPQANGGRAILDGIVSEHSVLSGKSQLEVRQVMSSRLLANLAIEINEDTFTALDFDARKAVLLHLAGEDPTMIDAIAIAEARADREMDSRNVSTATARAEAKKEELQAFESSLIPYFDGEMKDEDGRNIPADEATLYRLALEIGARSEYLSVGDTKKIVDDMLGTYTPNRVYETEQLIALVTTRPVPLANVRRLTKGMSDDDKRKVLVASRDAEKNFQVLDNEEVRAQLGILNRYTQQQFGVQVGNFFNLDETSPADLTGPQVVEVNKIFNDFRAQLRTLRGIGDADDENRPEWVKAVAGIFDVTTKALMNVKAEDSSDSPGASGLVRADPERLLKAIGQRAQSFVETLKAADVAGKPYRKATLSSADSAEPQADPPSPQAVRADAAVAVNAVAATAYFATSGYDTTSTTILNGDIAALAVGFTPDSLRDLDLDIKRQLTAEQRQEVYARGDSLTTRISNGVDALVNAHGDALEASAQVNRAMAGQATDVVSDALMSGGANYAAGLLRVENADRAVNTTVADALEDFVKGTPPTKEEIQARTEKILSETQSDSSTSGVATK
jgi:hypothetical protein